ncbi:MULTISPECIES: hypothetical protein [unclassified Pseudoclavibacter]|uniref:hypothetical protein n=1 Tax=unclassified Pseudoclavibacter TaxID=2615177 RepID=UPI001BA48916|nr:hypothetical protein [Pseudoclavibacter sp. Marseille-Q4354]MBS3178786.1 hypothetical protein [Pseudoclavibacter sp. Marseille-Q4354]
MVGREPKKRILRLASSPPRQGDAGSPAWPHDVDFVLSEDRVWTIGLSEGVGHGSAGRVISVDEALQTRSLAHVVKADGSWLVPHLRRLHAGGRVTEEELVEDYLSRHGRLPRVIA